MDWSPWIPGFNPTDNVVYVLENTLRSGPTPSLQVQNLGEQLTQLRMKINVVTLHKLVEA